MRGKLDTRTAVGGFFVLCVAACSSVKTRSLSDCITGWWTSGAGHGQCICPTQPECAASDCQSVTFRGFLADGTFYDGIVSWSAQAKTMSTEGTAEQGTYSVTNTAIQYVRGLGDAFSQKASCGGDKLTLNATDSVRADPKLADGLAAATSDGLTWKSFPLGP